MKKSIFLTIIFAASATFAGEIFELNASFEVSSCVATKRSGGPNTKVCSSPMAPAQPVRIELIDCLASATEMTCAGIWEQTISRDGHSFEAKIYVNKTSFSTGGEDVYSIDFVANPVGISAGAKTVVFTGHKLTGSFEFDGPELLLPVVAGKQESYIPNLRLEP